MVLCQFLGLQPPVQAEPFGGERSGTDTPSQDSELPSNPETQGRIVVMVLRV